MPERTIYSVGSGSALADLLASVWVTLALDPAGTDPVYIVVPDLGDFVALSNEARQFTALFPELAERSVIWFSDVLARVTKRREVRLICRHDARSTTLLQRPSLHGSAQPRFRHADPRALPNGILAAPHLYLEGRLRVAREELTFDGDRVIYRVAGDAAADRTIAAARQALDVAWQNLAPSAATGEVR